MTMPLHAIELPLCQLFEALTIHHGELFILQSHVKARRRSLEAGDPEKHLAGTKLVVSDLLCSGQNGDPVFYSAGAFGRRGLRYVEFLADVENRERLRAVSECYERFQDFRHDITAAVLATTADAKLRLSNANLFEFDEPATALFESQPDPIAAWRSIVEKFLKKDVQRVLRLMSPSLRHAEQSNNSRTLDLPLWYSSVAYVRHIVVHERGRGDRAALKSRLQPPDYFSVDAGSPIAGLVLSNRQAKLNISIFADYGYLIMRCVMQDLGLPFGLPRAYTAPHAL